MAARTAAAPRAEPTAATAPELWQHLCRLWNLKTPLKTLLDGFESSGVACAPFTLVHSCSDYSAGPPLLTHCHPLLVPSS